MSAKGQASSFDLGALCEHLRLAAHDLSDREPDPPLVGARLLDGARDLDLAVPPSREWSEWVKALDRHGWLRLDVLVRVFRETPSGDAVGTCLRADSARLRSAFPELCQREAKLLTVELLLKSPFRVEELARKWVHALGGTIAGETAKESAQRMERLDFGDVLKNLKAADADREKRMKKLKEIEAKRLKEQQEAYQRAGRE